MNPNKIEEGDIVNVNMNAAAMTLISKAEVLHTPCATGDSWRFKSIPEGTIVATSEPITVTLLEKHKTDQSF